MIPLCEISLNVACSRGPCCSASEHPGVRIAGAGLTPRGCDDSAAVKAQALFAFMGTLPKPTRGMDVWFLERLAQIAPLVCAVGGHPVDVPALTQRLSKGAVWQ